MNSFPGPNGLTKHLAFPPFHTELLTQKFWCASENLGRVKVIISEGTFGTRQGSTFKSKKNIVCFAFQHAPLFELQEANIAWPNPAMFRCMEPVFAHSTNAIQPDPSSHGHSPRREMKSPALAGPVCQMPQINKSVPPRLHRHGLPCVHMDVVPTPAPEFSGSPPAHAFSVPQGSRAIPTSSTDVSMADYGPLRVWEDGPHTFDNGGNPRSLHQAMSQSISDVVYTGSHSRRHTFGTRDDPLEGLPEELSPIKISSVGNEELLTPSRMMSRLQQGYNETPQSYGGTSPENDVGAANPQHFDAYYSPLRDMSSVGTFAPANTRVNSAMNTPPEALDPTAGKERGSPCPPSQHPRSLPVMAGDTLPETVCEVSGESLTSRAYVSHLEVGMPGPTQAQIASEKVKGRKEGKRTQRKASADAKTHAPRKSSGANVAGPCVDAVQSADGKRKREISMSTELGGSAEMTAGLTFSPVRKVSKGEGKMNVRTEAAKGDDGVKRAPLGQLLNH